MRTKLNLALLPDDVLLSTLAFSTLADVLTFPLVCRAFNSVAQNRALWIGALKAERLTRPIACPAYTDLTKLGLEDLRRIACLTHRLQRTWSIDNIDPPAPLSIAGPIKAIRLSKPITSEDPPHDILGLLDLIFQVPGTEFYVFHSRQTGHLVVWDVSIGRQVTDGLFVAARIVDVSAGRQTEGTFWMGLLVAHQLSFSCDKMMIVRLEYDAPLGPILTVTFEFTFKLNLSHWAIFMTTEYIGALECSDSPDINNPMDAYIRVLVVNIATMRKTLITTDISRDEGTAIGTHSGTSTVDDDTFILLETFDTSYVFRIPRDILPQDTNLDLSPFRNLVCYARGTRVEWDPGESKLFTPEGVLSANNSYGVPAVSLQAIDHESWDIAANEAPPESLMQVRFWVPELQSMPVQRGKAITPTLVPKYYANVEGRLQDTPDSAWKLMLLSHSGRMVLLVMDRGEHLELRLIVVDPELNNCVTRCLVVPPCVELKCVYGLSIDDHRGVITLLDTAGMLYAIPYA